MSLFSHWAWASSAAPQERRPASGAPATYPTVYSTPWCGSCRRLTRQLDRAGIAYVSVDIEQDATAARYVMEVNGGNRTVPTVVFADGTALTNPSLRDVLRRVQAW